MKTYYKVAAVAIPFAIISFILSRIIWPDPVGAAMPSASLLPHFIFISALESISFGIGMAFMIIGWFNFRERIKADCLSASAFVAVTWALVSWWPHDNMHRVNGMENFGGLIRIEYLFHLTLIIAGFTLALYLWRQLARTPNNNVSY